jgi:hypothetical protein
MAALRRESIPGSNSEPSSKSTENRRKTPSSKSELSHEKRNDLPSSETELSLKSATYAAVRKSNRNVRSFTQGVNKKTYVRGGSDENDPARFTLPDSLISRISPEDADMLKSQLLALPETQSSALMEMLNAQLRRGQVSNPVGWLLSMLKRAREGQLVMPEPPAGAGNTPRETAVVVPLVDASEPTTRSSPGQVASFIAEIRNKLFHAR